MDIATYALLDLCYNRSKTYTPLYCTLGQVRRMCEMLARAMPGYEFIPEPISDGGIQIIRWPGKMEGGYKTFRFVTSQGFPFLTDDVADGARFKMNRNSNVVAIQLKAFHGAPGFSDKELGAFREVFAEVIEMGEWVFYKRVLGKM